MNNNINKTPLKALYLEDSPKDVEIITELLADAGFELTLDCVDKKEKFISLLQNNNYDIILSDFRLIDLDAFEALKLVNEYCPHIPFICISGSVGEEIAIELIRQGAADYILKDRLVRLPSAILKAIEFMKEKQLREKYEKELIESERSYKELIDGMNETVWIIDFNGKVIDVNKRTEELLGYSKAELIPDGLYFVDSSLSKEQIQALASSMPEDKSQIFETSHKTKNGRIFPVEVCSSIVTYKGNKVILSIARDITERKQTEEKLRLIQKYEDLGTLAGGIAHDFNNILGIILAHITNMKNQKNDPEKISNCIDTVVSTIQRGKKLVQQILTFARKTETKFVPININDVIMEVMVMVLETFPKTITIVQDFGKEIPYVEADHTQLYQAILNLCVNARDAMPKGGTLIVNTDKISGDNLRIKYAGASASEYVCVTVTDTGEGMTEETKKHIFEPFFTTKDVGKGTGLGLAVVYGIIRAHNGFIDVESQLGKGTTFRFYIPASIIEMKPILKQEILPENVKGGSETILVIEDEEALLIPLKMVLDEKGYNVITVADGWEALKIYNEKINDIDLVITDFGLPKMSGLEVSRQIRKLNANQKLVLATGYLDPEMKEKFLAIGVKDFLYKPYEIVEVLKIIRDVIDAK